MAETTKPAKGKGTTRAETAKESINVERVVAGADGAFKLNEARTDIRSVEIADVDLLVRFSDGSNLLIPNGALDALSPTPPKVSFLDSQTTAAELIKLAGKANTVTAGNVRIITDQLDTRDHDPGSADLADGDAAAQNLPQVDLQIQPPAPQASKPSGAVGPFKGSGGNKGDGLDTVMTPQTAIPLAYKPGKTIDPQREPAGDHTITSYMKLSADYKVTSSAGITPTHPVGYDQAYDSVSKPTGAAYQSYKQQVTGSSGADLITANTAAIPSDVISQAPAGAALVSTVLHIDVTGIDTLNSITLKTDNTLGAFKFYISSSQATYSVSSGIPTWNLVLSSDTISKGIDLVLYYEALPDGGLDTATYSFLKSIQKLYLESSGSSNGVAVPSSNIYTFVLADAQTTSDYISAGVNYVLPAYGRGYVYDLKAGNDTLHAGAGHDSVLGGDGNDLIYGDGGNDTLDGGAGADTLDGGTGTNTASYQSATSGVTVALDNALNASVGTGDAAGDHFTNIQNLTGSAYNDHLIGDASANYIKGGDGDDLLEGRGGADTLDGGAGNNTVSYTYTTADHVVASLTTGLSGVTLYGDAVGVTYINIQNLQGSTSADQLYGSSAANILDGGLGNDLLEGLGGADTLIGGGGVDTASYVHAGQGVAVSLAAVGAASFAGGTVSFGSATANDLSGNLVTGVKTSGSAAGDADGDLLVGITNLRGSAYDDLLIGSSANNTLEGLAGNDTLEGGAGADSIDGGIGTNTASYEHAGAGVFASLSTIAAMSFNGGTVSSSLTGSLVTISGSTAGDAAGDSLRNITNLTGSAYADYLVGDSNANTLIGGAGNDTLEGLGSGDAFYGGGGTDTVSYAHSSGYVAVTLTTGLIANQGDAYGDTFDSIENLIGSVGNDTLYGDANNNVLDGGSGDDVLQGLAGSDTLIGGANGSFGDTASYQDAGAAVVVSLTAGLTSGSVSFSAVSNVNGVTGLNGVLVTGTAAGDGNGDVLAGIENLTGSAYGDVLIGSTGTNSIYGGDGNDTLEGYGGSDTLNGGSGSDWVSYAHSGTPVNASLFYGLLGSATSVNAQEYYISIENIEGSAGADLLIGDNNNNIVRGNAYVTGAPTDSAVDSLEGLGGADTLIGDGNDTASYAHAISGGVTAILLNQGETQLHDLSDVTLAGDAVGVGGASDVYVGIANLLGSNFADSLIGNDSANLIAGGVGADTLEGLGGADTLDGGDAASGDTASYAHALAGVTASLSTGVFNGVTFTSATGGGVSNGSASGDAAGDVIRNVRNLTGSKTYASYLVGDGNANLLTGGSGNDTFEGQGGNDTFSGGGGTDTVTFINDSAAGVVASLTTLPSVSTTYAHSYINIENLEGTTSADLLIGNASANSLKGNGGNDTLEGLAGADTLDGSGGVTTASYARAASGVVASLSAGTFGGVSFTSLSSGTLTGAISNGGTAATAGDAGGDVLYNITNLTGSDYADTLIGNASANTLLGGLGNDSLYGGAGDDSLSGGSGDDTLEGGAGADTLDGGGGTNLVTYENSAPGITAVLYGNRVNSDGSPIAESTTRSGLPTITSGSDAYGDKYASIQNLKGTSGTDVLIGDESANVIYDGGGSGDTLEGLGGADTFIATGSNTVVTYAHALVGVVASLQSGLVSETDDAAGDTFVNIHNLYGSSYADTLIGSTDADTLQGGGGQDELEGYSGADAIVGASGDHDIASYAHAAAKSGSPVLAGVALSLDSSATQTALDAILTSVGLTAGSVTLTTGTDTLGSYLKIGGTASVVGDAYNDRLYNITDLRGSAYADLLIGSTGANSLYGGSGNDTLRGVVDLSTQVSGNDSLFGEDGDDVLYGSWNTSGGDSLSGGAGNDTLYGTLGADTLDGGAGTNTLVVTADISLYRLLTLNFTSSSLTYQQNVSGTWVTQSATSTFLNIQQVQGGTNSETFYMDLGGRVVDGGGGNDRISYYYWNQLVKDSSGNYLAVKIDASGSTGVVTQLGVVGGAADYFTNLGSGRTLEGTLNGSDSIIGSSLDDTLTGFMGVDTLDGGGGTNLWNISTNGASPNASATISIFQNGATSYVLASLTAIAGVNAKTGDSTGIGQYNGADFDLYTYTGVTANSWGTYTNASGTVTALSMTGLPGSTAANITAGITNDVVRNIQLVWGTSYNDWIIGDSAANTLYGNAGDDVLEGMAGADYMDGGTGSNTVNYSHSGSGVIAALSAGTWTSGSRTATTTSSGSVITITGTVANVGDASGDRFSNVQNLIGSTFDDILGGSATANSLDGGAGNDTLYGLAGADVLQGGAGNDLLDGGSDTDADTLDGGAGNDTLTFSSLATGYGVFVTLNGSSSSVVAAVTGNPTSGSGADVIVNFENVIGSQYADSIVGDSNANSLQGGAGNDTLNGGTGDDTLDGGTGNDSLIGGGGNDWVSFASATTTAVTVNLSAASNQAVGGASDTGTDQISGIYNVIGSGFADSILGDANANSLYGGNGNDTIDGGTGATLAASNYLLGGDLSADTGTDTLSYASMGATGVSVTLAEAGSTATVTIGTRVDTIGGFENLIGSTSGNDTLYGNSSANTITVAGGNNYINGMAGADSLVGGAGADTIDGGDVNSADVDTLNGGAGIDTVTFINLNTSGVTVALNGSTQVTISGGAGADRLVNFENVIGSKFSDNITGDSNANVIDGGDRTSAVEDTLNGGVGTDTLTYALLATGSGVNITLGAGGAQTTISGGAGADVISNFEYLIGSSYDDTLIGNSALNSIDGGAGADVIDGGTSGTDSLIGGTGNDTIGVTDNASNGNVYIDGGADNDSITGGRGNDSILGGTGLDTIFGMAGNDTIDGGSDNSIDTMDGGAGIDTLTFASLTTGSGVNVTLGTYNSGTGASAQTTISGGAGSDVIQNFEYITGSQYADTLTGNGAANSINGGLGNDVLEGGGGADTLVGGGGTDTVAYSGSSTGVTASLTTGTYNGVSFTTDAGTGGVKNNSASGDASGDVLAAITNLTGSAYNDYLVGNATNAHTLIGGAGNDTIISLNTSDMIGGSTETGNDVFSTLSTAYANAGAINGGAGTDGLYVSGLVTGNPLSLSTLTGISNTVSTATSKITNMEVLSLIGDGLLNPASTIATNITVTTSDVRNFTGLSSGTADMYIVHDATDTANFVGFSVQSSSTTAGISFNGTTYNNDTVYQSTTDTSVHIHWLS